MTKYITLLAKLFKYPIGLETKGEKIGSTVSENSMKFRTFCRVFHLMTAIK